ncbi:hypothetical protein BpHYR1_015196 [Brachionus plicatilis]|uniref:Uncharacterized protein n=1 Tax=Brachionus plicatilis TaxID=10195 RepID=A0A3M7QJZ1_BRAPC|nr:hypothetical protein BpHYR1_015196 [Brachionus plicatilis]
MRQNPPSYGLDDNFKKKFLEYLSKTIILNAKCCIKFPLNFIEMQNSEKLQKSNVLFLITSEKDC